MTRDEIVAMEAGRKLDALIAERLFGWSPIPNNTPWRMLPPEGSSGRKEGRVYPVPDYSTNIYQAWKVVEECRQRWMRDESGEPLFWQFVDCGSAGWRVDVMWEHHDGTVPVERVGPDVLPLAVCKAALLTVWGEPGTDDVALDEITF